jgi:predicted nucleic acid-binding protein
VRGLYHFWGVMCGGIWYNTAMKKLKVYLDTSVISAYFDFHKPVRQLVTQKWFQNDIKSVIPCVSVLVIDEINNNPDVQLKMKMLGLIESRGIEVLSLNDDILKLAASYRSKVIPKEINDSVHLAVAAYYSLSAVVSWNFKHIVNLSTIKSIHDINSQKGYPVIEIITVEQLGGDKYGSL